MNSSVSDVLHPAGEVVFTFSTDGGHVRLCPTDDVLTPFGGLVTVGRVSEAVRVD